MTSHKDTENQEIRDLQSLIAHQDRQIQELNEVVIDQGKEIDAIKKYVQAQKSKLQELENNLGEIGNNEPLSATDEAALNKPPHY